MSKASTELDFRDETLSEEATQLTTREEVKKFANELSMIIRATKGLPIEPEEWYSKLINVKDPDERSRFPTYPLLARQVSLRLLAKRYGDKAEACKTWADLNASGLIGYHGLGRKEYVEMSKAVMGESQSIYVGSRQEKIEQKQKRGIFSRFRKQKEPETEFTNT